MDQVPTAYLRITPANQFGNTHLGHIGQGLLHVIQDLLKLLCAGNPRRKSSSAHPQHLSSYGLIPSRFVKGRRDLFQLMVAISMTFIGGLLLPFRPLRPSGFGQHCQFVAWFACHFFHPHSTFILSLYFSTKCLRSPTKSEYFAVSIVMLISFMVSSWAE